MTGRRKRWPGQSGVPARAAARAHPESGADMEGPFRETEGLRERGTKSMPSHVRTFPGGRQRLIEEAGVELFAAAFQDARRMAA